MMKNILAILGALALIVVIVVWQFGFLSKQTQDIKLSVERATAVQRAEKMIENTKGQIKEFTEKVRGYKIEAATLEQSWNREQAAIEKQRTAMRQLAQAAKEIGLPSYIDRDSLSKDQQTLTLTFSGKTITAPEVYTTLESWEARLQKLIGAANQKKTRIDALRAAGTKIEQSQEELEQVVGKLEARLEELCAARDMAKIDAELAELTANAEGVDVGKIGEILDTIQGEIDEATATAIVLAEETGKTSSELTPDDVTAAPVAESDLDKLWE